jgi:hypothetical protein
MNTASVFDHTSSSSMKLQLAQLVAVVAAANETRTDMACHDCLFATAAGSAVIIFGIALCCAQASQRSPPSKRTLSAEAHNRDTALQSIESVAVATQQPNAHSSGNEPSNPAPLPMPSHHGVPSSHRVARDISLQQKQPSVGARLPPLERRPYVPSTLDEVGDADPRYLGGWTPSSRYPASKRQVVPVRVAPVLPSTGSFMVPRT